MSQTAQISVIVPVYNAETYLDECIRSILCQSWRDLELILVNDGSTDGSLKICRHWARDPRVKLLSTENHGVSHARNLGLQIAAGEWILFVDSDDYLLEGCLEKLVSLTAPDAQLILADYTSSAPELRPHRHGTVSAASLGSMTLDPINNRLLPGFYESKPMSFSACWARLYRGRVIREKNLRFHEGLRLSEDTLFNLDYLSCIDTVVVTDLPVLYYRHPPSSVTSVFNAGQLTDRFRFFDLLQERHEDGTAVHILSLLFLEICRIERSAAGPARRQLEQRISGYLSRNSVLLRHTKARILSQGRWQRLFYHAAAFCFRHGTHSAGFFVLRVYSFLAEGIPRPAAGNAP